MALVPQIADAVRIPVLVAGGTADGQGITAAFALGASGVQLGTAFLGCPEAAVPPLYPAQLNTVSDDAPEVTPAFTDRPARAIRNRFVAEMDGAEALKFPLQASIVGPLWASARRTRPRPVDAVLGGPGRGTNPRAAGGRAGR
jgi:nitronate monooxygenase